jgi:2'-5' RNA ligase
LTDNLLEIEAKAIDPSRFSAQSRAADSLYAPTSDVAGGSGIFWLTMGAALDEEPHWNAIYPNWRDKYLLNFSRTEGMLASALYSMKTRIGTLEHSVNGPPRAKKFAEDLLKSPGLGDNLREIVQKISGDLDTSDNGAFMELWRPGKPDSDAGNRPVLGFAHLDSRQCWRSFDPEFPVWYTHPVTGQIRRLHRSRVVFSADNPQSVELARGIGFCAVSRILLMARTFRSMQIFLNEKVSGRFTRAIGAVNGLTAGQFRKALQSNEAENDSRGYLVYKDIPFFFNPSGQANDEIKIMLQDLASIPDGFVFREDADLYAYMLAFAFGVDAREFWPATQSGATKADASVQNMKAQGRGIGNRIETVADMIRRALPETVEFEFDYTDDAQDDQAAKINQTRATTYDMMVKNGTITAQESRAMSIAVGILDQTVLDTMVAPATSDSNPETPQPDALPQPGAQTDNPAQDANKAADNSAFVYVPLPNDSGILEIQQRVRNVLGINGIEYQDPETFHVTLLYCTEATGDQLQKVIESSPVSSLLTIESKHLGIFENGEERALYLEVERDSNLVTLQSNVFQAFTQNGLGNQLSSFSSPGSYKPHITLAYLPSGVDIPNLSVNLSTTAARYAFGRSEYQIVASKQKDGAAQKSVSMYRKSMRDAVRGLWSGALSQYDYHVTMGAAINRQFPLAWNEGAAKFGIFDTERSDEEEQRLTLEINTEISYIAGFGLDIMDNSKENGGALQPLLDRAELWVNSYERIVMLAGTMAAADQKGEWMYGDTEDHCPSCSGYAGRVYRNSTWRKFLEPYDLMPKGKGLACGGWKCDCGIKPTDKPITRGRPPIIQKMLHVHLPEALSA